MGKNRNYNCSDVDMTMTSKTVAESFKAYISELSGVRTDWTESYANSLITRIDNAIDKYLGVDAKKALREATASLTAIQVPAKRDVSFFKTQIDDDFKKEPARRDEILRTLGFSKYLKAVQKGNQEALIQLLYTFKTNMNESLKAEITGKGMNVSLIDNSNEYADTFSRANVSQEYNKEATREITKEVTEVFNAIYDEIIGICKKASSYYQYEPLKKEQFTFSKVLANLGAARKAVSIVA